MAATISQTPRKTAPSAEADELIRSFVDADRRSTRRKALPDLEPVAEQSVPNKNRHRTRVKPGHSAKVVGRYRPKRKHLIWAALAVIMIVRPWLIPAILLATFWIGLIAYLTLGHDRIADGLSAFWAKLKERRPELAERLRQRADTFALKFDALLDRLPERWADKLALPDLSQPGPGQTTLDDLPDPFDKLRASPEVYRG